MKRTVLIAVLLGLASAPAAFAQPAKMSETQLDQVVAGQGLIEVSVSNVGNPSVNAPVNVNAPVTVSVLSLGLPG